MTTLAKLMFEDGTEATLEQGMTWAHEDESVQVELNEFFTDHQPGDHQQPDGCAQALRASNFYAADLEYGSPPFNGGDVIGDDMTTNRKGGNNCGIGSGGFAKGNKCAVGGKASPGGKGGKDASPASTVAPASERKATAAVAAKKIEAAPVPPKEKVKAYRAKLALARKEGEKARKEGRSFSQREFLDARGNSKDRKRRAVMLFEEFGGTKRGYVVCHVTGLKMHYTDDPKLNPKGYPKFEQGKIFIAEQGGGYQPHNLLPESFVANRTRNNTPVRTENLE